MKKILFFWILASSMLFSQNQNFVKGEILIKLKESNRGKIYLNSASKSLGINSLDQLNRAHKVKNIEAIGNYQKTLTFLVQLNSTEEVGQLCKIYSGNENVEFAEPNYIVSLAGERGVDMTTTPNDTYFASRQWGMKNNGSFTVSGMTMGVTAGADVKMTEAWDIETGDPNMIIAVSDTGVNFTHEDISARIWNNTADPVDGIDNDGNGYIDDFQGWNWVSSNNNIKDDHGHGTNCAGIFAATSNNAKGYTGANWNSKIMNLKVLGSDGTGSYASMANSLYYAVDKGAKVVSMSIGGTGTSSTFENAINYMKTHNVLLVVCMMNTNSEVTYYPAGYSLTYDNVIAVGSTDADDKRTHPFFWSTTSGSNYGTHINVCAPGNYIYGLPHNSNTGYNSYWGGTSQATPLVAGIASLILSKKPSLTPAQVRSILQQTADDQVGLPSEDTPGFDKYHGWGRVNAFKALQKALAVNDVSVTNGVQVINPVKNKKIQIINQLNDRGIAEITIYSFDGKLILSQKINVQKGRLEIDANQLSTGNYILNYHSVEYKKSFKITIQ